MNGTGGRCAGVRGAIGVAANTDSAILEATRALLEAIVEANGIHRDDVAAIFFSTTPDLTAEYPAVAARQLGWSDVAFLCSHEMEVPHGMPRCLRVLLLWNTDRAVDEIRHIYLGEAKRLRPDRSRIGSGAGAPEAAATSSSEAQTGVGALHVHIIGLGLMGGSLALALRGRVRRITGDDASADVVREALETGVIDAQGGRERAGVVVLAIPTDAIPALLPGLRVRPGALVLDLGSAKADVCRAMAGLPAGVLAVGGHPMCGRAESGLDHATAVLYRGATFVLCESARTTEAARALAETIVQAVGARPLWLDAERHDAAVAHTSHVQHLVACVLAEIAAEAALRDEVVRTLTGGGFHGATRLAASDPAMIRGMLASNRTEVRRVAALVRQRMERIEAMLDDAATLQDALARGHAARRVFGRLP